MAEIESKNLTYVVPKLFEDQPYLFRVSAINAEGQGKPLQMDTEVVPKKPAGGSFSEAEMMNNYSRSKILYSKKGKRSLISILLIHKVKG